MNNRRREAPKRVRFGIELHPDVYDQLQKLSDELKLSKVSIITLAIGKMARESENVDRHASLQSASR